MSGDKLSKAGKLRLEQAFLARANGHSITPHLQAAIDALHTADTAGMKLDDWLAQRDFVTRLSHEAKVLARCLDRLGQNAIRDTAKAWAAAADFGAPQPKETFRIWEEAPKK